MRTWGHKHMGMWGDMGTWGHKDVGIWGDNDGDGVTLMGVR